MSAQASSSRREQDGMSSGQAGPSGDSNDPGEVDTAFLRQPSVMTRMLW